MSDEKPLSPSALRKAFGELKGRLDRLEQKVRDQEAEAQDRIEYIRKCQRKIDNYSLEVDRLLPRLVAAEAQLGRANCAHEKLWGVLADTNHGITALRDMVDSIGRPQDVGEADSLDDPVG